MAEINGHIVSMRNVASWKEGCISKY